MYIQIKDKNYRVEHVDNSSTKALLSLLDKGPVTIDMRDYGQMEKVGQLP